MIHHQLRTPIAGILGSMDLLTEMAQLNDEQMALLRIAHTCGEQLSTVIDDILDFTKLQEKKVVLQEEEFSLRELLERALEVSSFSLRGKSIELLLEPPAEDVRYHYCVENIWTEPEISGSGPCHRGSITGPADHPQPTKQLCKARVASSSFSLTHHRFTNRGIVSVSVSGTALPTEGARKCTLNVSVRDTGIGIPASVRDKLFQPFSQGTVYI